MAHPWLRLILDDPELVPIGIGEHEGRAPVLLLDGSRDLDAVLAEPPFLAHDVLRREEETRVPLLPAGVRTEMESNVRAPRRNRDPVRPGRHNTESDLLLPPRG